MRKKRIFSSVIVIIFLVQLIGSPQVGLGAASFKEELPTLGEAEPFSVLASQSIASIGVSKVTGGLGISPGTEDQKKGEWIVEGESYFGPSSLAEQGLKSAKAYADYLKTLECSTIPSLETVQELTVLNPGVYCYEESLTIDTDILLDSQGDPEAKFVFKVPKNLEIGQGVSIASPEPKTSESVYWLVDGDVLLEDESELTGTLIAEGSITAGKWVSVTGRLITLEGGISVDEISVTTVIGELPPEPTEVPPVEPTQLPTELPTPDPTVEPTQVPTEVPTLVPTEIPTELPTPEPTLEPTEVPPVEPTQVPTELPTLEPTEEPTPTPTKLPPEEPTELPTDVPTVEPTQIPLEEPTQKPTEEPNFYPTYLDNPYLSEDGLAAYNAVPPLVIVVDPDPSRRGIQVPQSPEVKAAIQGASNASATFSITFASAGQKDKWGATCQTFPDAAKTALNAAAAIWANTIRSSVPITIFACWSDFGSEEVLGYSGGEPLHLNFNGAPLPNVWYQGALANAISGSDLDPSNYDDHITYNSRFTWYYGTDGKPPAGTYDLVSVAAHEIAHGLNFAGSASYSAGYGSYGWFNYPIVYDTFMEDSRGKKLLSYTNLSTALGNLLTSNNLWFNGPNSKAANGGSRVKMYAPSTWSSGSSYSHLDKKTFAGTSNSLMVYSIGPGSAQHNPGAVTKGILKDMGWPFPASSYIPTPILPIGTITDVTPTYTWTVVPGATQYMYQVVQGSTVIYTKTVSSSVCNGSTCSSTPSTQLGGGDYSWRVKAYVGAWKNYSGWKAFKVKTIPTVVAPIGVTPATSPTYKWSAIQSASQYNFQVVKGGTLLYSLTIGKNQCDSNICSYNTSRLLSDGVYSWRVRSYIGGVWRKFSPWTSFTVKAQPGLVAPVGTITDTTPTYTWKIVPDASKYAYQLIKNGNQVYYKEVSTAGCGSTTCSSTPSTVLGYGTYTWRARAYVGTAWRTYSAAKTFTIKAPVGFSSQFNGSMKYWSRKAGGTWQVSSNYMYTNGMGDSFSSVYRNTAQYENFDYSARVKRLGGGDYYVGYPAQYLAVRMGTGVSSNNRWYPGYLFGYADSGRYSIWKRNPDGSTTNIRPWTYSPAIKEYDWNVLRVVANGGNFRFYINGSLVYTFSDYSRSKGYVGFEMYKVYGYTTQFLVDWAKLTVLSTTYQNNDIVSPEQEALNIAAMNDSNVSTPEVDVKTQ